MKKSEFILQVTIYYLGGKKRAEFEMIREVIDGYVVFIPLYYFKSIKSILHESLQLVFILFHGDKIIEHFTQDYKMWKDLPLINKLDTNSQLWRKEQIKKCKYVLWYWYFLDDFKVKKKIILEYK